MKGKAMIRVATALLVLSFGAMAQTYPSKPVRFLVSSQGSPQDVVGRIVGQKLSDAWGQPVLVENRAGAGGLLSITGTAKAPPDGYTVLIASSAYAVNPYLYANVGYDPEKDLAPVVLIATSPNIIVAIPSFGADTLRDAVAKAKSGTLNYASPGLGTTPQMSAEYVFRSLAGVQITHVPYKTVGQLMAALYGGEVPVAGLALPVSIPPIRAGKLRGLAVTSGKRSPALPDVPTVAEAGYKGFEDVTWVGMLLPAGTPQPIISRLHADTEKALALPDVREKLLALGFEPQGGTPQQYTAYIRQELAKWAKVVKALAIKPE
jgi:tripartite-type tricarboxylate transporter receptor subunit TctC